MAHGGPNSAGSQFFITFRPTATLNGKHTCFGRVIEGLEIVRQITKVNPTLAKDEFCQTPPETSEEEVKDLPIKEDKPGDVTTLTNEQRKNYEKLVSKVTGKETSRSSKSGLASL